MRDGQVDAGRRRGRLGPRPEHLSGRRRGLAPGGGRALHLRHRRGARASRSRSGCQHAHRPRGVLLVHQADGAVAGALHVLQQRPQALRARRASTLGIDDRTATCPSREGGPDGQVQPARQRPLRRRQVSIDFVGRKWLWYAISGDHRRRSPSLGSTSRASTSASSSTAASSTTSASPPARSPRTTSTSSRNAVAGTGIDAAASPIVTTVRRDSIRVADRAADQRPRPTRSPTRSPQAVDVDAKDDISHRRDRRQLGRGGREAGPDRPRGLPGPGGAVHLGATSASGRCRWPRIVALAHDLVITVGIYALSGLRGHPGDRHRPADDPRLLALRHRRRLRQGAREHQEPAPDADVRTPRRPTSRSTRPWCGRSTPRSSRCSRSARSSTSASSSSARAPSRTSRSRCSSAWPPVPTRRSSSPRRCSCS